ncbi:MAG: WGR domain-containing protein [Candidatus Acetothermia bacterium]
MMSKLIASWKSIKPEENRYRHYSLKLEEDLWGNEMLVKRWGRIGGRKREAYFWLESHQELLEKIEEVAGKRVDHGYRAEKALFS